MCTLEYIFEILKMLMIVTASMLTLSHLFYFVEVRLFVLTCTFNFCEINKENIFISYIILPDCVMHLFILIQLGWIKDRSWCVFNSN